MESGRAQLPAASWLGRDQRDLDRDIDRLLGEVLTVLGTSEITALRLRYEEADRGMTARRARVRELREAALAAPDEKSVLQFYRKTRPEFLEEIEALEKDIAALREQQNGWVDELADAYAALGLRMQREEVRVHLASVSGGDLMTLTAVFHNLRGLNSQLEELVRQSPDDPEAARRYYGLHVLLLRTALLAHAEVITRMDQRYLKRLEELDRENQGLTRETGQLLRFAEESDRKVLEANLRTQELTAESLRLYRDHLISARARVYESEKTLQRRYEVAMNAYQTIRISAALAEEMRQAVRDLDSLRDMRLPELAPLQDEGLRLKFSEITRELLRE
jgi:hypothetical protein